VESWKAGEPNQIAPVPSTSTSRLTRSSPIRAHHYVAMIYSEPDDVENTPGQLIEVLRLDPSDSWNGVVLGNLDASGKGDHSFNPFPIPEWK
jgi:hypothetical protein